MQRLHYYEYPEMLKKLGTFSLKVEAGNFSDSEIIVMLGQNGTGKSTFIRLGCFLGFNFKGLEAVRRV